MIANSVVGASRPVFRCVFADLLLVSFMAACSGEPQSGPQKVAGQESRAMSCTAPNSADAPALTLDPPVDWMAGDYDLVMVATSGIEGATSTSGRLHLKARTTPLTVSWPERTSPVYGWMDVDLKPFGRINLAYPPSDRDPNRPGVDVIHDTRDRSLVLTLGAAGSGDVVYFDAGIMMFVHSVTNLSIAGRWQASGNVVPPLAGGYFCATRVSGKTEE